MTNNSDGLSDARALFEAAIHRRFPRADAQTVIALATDISAITTPPASTSTAIAAGFVMVPVKPTEAMSDAARQVQREGGWVRNFWSAMLAAAPKAASVADQLRADLHNVQRNTAIYRQEAKDRADAADRRAADANARADAAVEANRRLVAMMESPKAASEDGATGLLREAVQREVDGLKGADSPWAVGIRKRLLAALAASPTDATGAGEDPRAAFYGESTAAQDVLPTTQVVAIDSFLRAVSRINLPVAGETL